MSTQVACLTPPGSGAIAVIALRGPDAWSIVRRFFRPASKKTLPDKPSERATWFGHIGAGEGAGDDAILAVPSLHPDPVVEIHCHGGRQVVQWLIDLLKNECCIETSPEKLVAANEAWALLPHAKTLRTAGILLDQAQGAFDRAVAAIRKAQSDNRTAEAQALLNELNRYTTVARHLIEPWHVAIAGAPNAGKSSLLNALAGYQRSVVAPLPGTTRDVVTATLAFDGWPVEISDTAGLRKVDPALRDGSGMSDPSRSAGSTLREGGDELEAEGIARARKHLAEADLCLWVIDTTGPQPPTLASFASENEIAAERVLTVLNKIDQAPAWDLTRIPDAIRISATTGQGIDVLIRKMVDMLVPDPPPPGAPVPYSESVIRFVQSMKIA